MKNVYQEFRSIRAPHLVDLVAGMEKEKRWILKKKKKKALHREFYLNIRSLLL